MVRRYLRTLSNRAITLDFWTHLPALVDKEIDHVHDVENVYNDNRVGDVAVLLVLQRGIGQVAWGLISLSKGPMLEKKAYMRVQAMMPGRPL